MKRTFLKRTFLTILVFGFIFTLSAQEVQYKVVADIPDQMQLGLKALTVYSNNGTEKSVKLHQNPTDSSWVLICLDESVINQVNTYVKEHEKQKFVMKLVSLDKKSEISLPAGSKSEQTIDCVLLKCVVDDIPRTIQDRVMKVEGVQKINKVADETGDSIWVVTCDSSCDKNKLKQELNEVKKDERISCHFEEIEKANPQSCTLSGTNSQQKTGSQNKTPATSSPNISASAPIAATTKTPPAQPQSMNNPAHGLPPAQHPVGKYSNTTFLFAEDSSLFKVSKTLKEEQIHPAMRDFHKMAKIIQEMNEKLGYIEEYVKSNSVQIINELLDEISGLDIDLDEYRNKEMEYLTPAQQKFYKDVYSKFGAYWNKYK